MNKMTDAQKAYIAGIIDGDGCIYITKLQPVKSRRQKSPSYNVAVSVKMTSHAVITWLHSVTGIGSVSFSDKSKRDNNRDCWSWFCSIRQAKQLLIEVEPFLVLKKENARLLIEIAGIRELTKRGYAMTSANQPERQEEIFNRMKFLNRKGRRNYMVAPISQGEPNATL